ncbi:site-specific DNA-methyltransferase [candidate division NPL-UPA2 bacterium Unc8]|uniref:Site-specific DNA-methyltransferase n=1 Tax=candidate division NPL-UPA2 bacterium Unc8 TaxID=1980939 RepID=A0A399FXC9_UNCN2|nr:MAG: site-specific DNA-methyltransferase [candidate division NPL-UPA2 bacterium Unc8]
MDTIQKFQNLLKRLFQFEASDLDFGIYRVLNYKRDRVEKFIQEDLKNKVESAFAKHKGERLTDINRRFEEAKEKVVQALGTKSFTPTGELKEEFKDTPLGRDFLSVKAQRDEAQAIDEIKLQVFNDLYNFFSRYYEEGDFAPHYRYSIKGHKYAIPYNGEEVKLYWANNEQYYTKTGLLFRDYTFEANEYKVIFRIVSVREELGAKKATKARFFILDDENPVEIILSPLVGEGKGEGDNKNLIIRFQYRELTEEEVKSYGVEGGSNTSKQEKINQKIYDEVLKKIEGIELKSFLSKEYKNERPLLLYQISRFTAKNTKDYFIHKNLKKFLAEQLDYFIKAEVLSLETLEKERFLDKHITRAKVVREIGESLIDFLSQIEDFQKRLWEKKKFVLKTEYVITTDRIPEEFYDEILKSKEQLKEWKELGFVIARNEVTKQSLKNLHLPIDTKYFSQEFKEKLLEKLTSSPVIARSGSDEAIPLDDLLDGILIKSENFQALNLLLEKYKEKVKCIYIDPPYNTGNDEFLYRDRYQHSSWLSMMENRLQLARKLMREDGVIFVSIDDNEIEEFKKMSIWNSLYFISCFIRKSGVAPRMDVKFIATEHDYVLCLAKNFEKASINKQLAELEDYPFQDEFITQRGKFKLNKLDRGSIHYSESLDYSIELKKGSKIDLMIRSKIIEYDLQEDIEIWPGGDPLDKRWTWRWSKEKVEWGIKNHLIVFKKQNKRWTVYFKQYQFVDNELNPTKRENPYRTLLLDFTNEIGTKEIENFFGDAVFTSYPKPVSLIKHVIKIGASNESFILDYFAGSGTTADAVMKLNKEDGGKRKYILVEMADYFDTVIIPRLKKVCYSFNWKEGTPQDTDGISQFFKYQILEQYEDTLDNIELTSNRQAELKFGDDYLLKYFLDCETRPVCRGGHGTGRGNPSLLNIEKLKNPFSYKLKVNLEEVGEPQEMIVDVPETFNYLLGLKVKKIKARETPSPLPSPARGEGSKRKYLFILGEKEGKEIAIAWREYNDNWNEDDFKKDKEFIIQELEPWAPHIVYINGQSVLTPKLGKHTAEIRYVEPEFKNLMG